MKLHFDNLPEIETILNLNINKTCKISVFECCTAINFTLKLIPFCAVNKYFSVKSSFCSISLSLC